MTEIDMARQYGHNMEVEFADTKNAFNIGYKSFLAGLHEGQPKWHKVADGDLPKEHKLYLCAIKNNGNSICYFNGLHWENKYSMGDFGHCVETVIAWCEIPSFNLEEQKRI